jgi:hypothetical protein
VFGDDEGYEGGGGDLEPQRPVPSEGGGEHGGPLNEVEGSEDEEPDDNPEGDDRHRPQITHQNVDHAE